MSVSNISKDTHMKAIVYTNAIAFESAYSNWMFKYEQPPQSMGRLLEGILRIGPSAKVRAYPPGSC
jgi:hypothetical protein